MKGYEKLGKYLDAKGVVISVIISLVMIYVANQVAWTIEITNIFNEVGQQLSFFDVYRNLLDILKEIEILSGEINIVSSFYSDLIIGYVLSAIAIIPSIIRAFKAVTAHSKITKLN